jgi:ribosomal protein S10
MKFARDFNGFLVDAEINKSHGNFTCPQCHNLMHWRKMSVNQRRPHFYHAKANEDCPLSVIGGKWTLVENDNVIFSSELGRSKINFPRKTKPNLSKIPSELVPGLESKEQISQAIMKIQLTSSDAAQLDSTVSVFCDLLTNQKVSLFAAIPLPVRIVSVQGTESSRKRIHRRLIKIIGSTPELVENFSLINIPENVDLSIHLL